MKIIRPVQVTDAVLASSNVPESEDAWDIEATYAKDAIVRGMAAGTTHNLYLSLQDSNLGHAVTEPLWWVQMGPSNRWAMFDGSNSTQTENPDSVEVSLELTSRVDSLALLNIAAATAQVIMTDAVEGVVYDQTFDLVSDSGIIDWWSYFFEPISRKSDLIVSGLPPFAVSTIEVKLSDVSADVRIGTLIVGLSKQIGETAMGASIGIQDYSRKEQNPFGDFVLVERAYSKRANFTVWVRRGFTDELQRMLASYRATPIVYVGSETFGSTAVFGFYRDFSIAIEYPTHSICTLEIIGLT